MNNRLHILCVTVVAFAAVGCDSDRIEPRGNWRLDGGSDGHLMEVGGPDADASLSDADGGGSDGGVSDGGDTDPKQPPEYSPDPAIPSQPASNTVCNDNQWCWLHPSPLPHSIDNLRSVDGQVYATAYDGAVRGWQPMVWDSSGFTLLDKPVAPNQEIIDMTTTPKGWIALTPDGTVHDVRPDGVPASRPHDGEDFKGLLGVSFDAYLAWESDRDAVLRINNQSLEYNALPTTPAKTTMWEDGTLWGIAELRDDKREFLSGDWVAYPEPSGFFDDEVTALGPSPTSECASAGLWIASDAGEAFRWDEFDARWNEYTHPGGQMRAIGCGTQATPTAVDDEGGLLRWSGGAWRSENVARLGLNDFVPHDGETYLAGTYGTLVRTSDSGVDHGSDGFRIPSSESPSYYGTGYQDMWVSADGQTLVLAHGSGLYMGTEQGWSKMAAPDGLESGLTQDARVEVWGLNKPQFAMVGSRILRWNGTRWQPSALPEAATDNGRAVDLTGINQSEVWLASETALFFFDGDAWRVAIDARDLTVSAIEPGDDGSVIVGASGALYDVTGTEGNWRLQKRTATPCQDIRAILVTANATYVAGFSGCVARKRQGSWTEYRLPEKSDWPPTVFAPKAYEVIAGGGDLPALVATSVGLIGLNEDGTTGIQYVGDFRDLSVSGSNSAILALHRSGVVARYFGSR